jgi:hypothetical protein
MWLCALSLALVAVPLSCGVPGGGPFNAIEDEDIPFGLGEPTTTTVVTTTTSTTIVPNTTVGPTTSTIPTEPVTLYFLAGEQLVSIELALVRPASLPQVMAALEQGPPRGPAAPGLRSALRTDATNSVRESGGVATVDLAPNLFEALPLTDQRLAIAQIVLTLTKQRGIGQVRFTQNDEPIAVPLGSGEFTEPGQAVSHSDYAELLDDSPPPITTTTEPPTTTSTTSTTTTMPPEPVSVVSSGGPQ